MASLEKQRNRQRNKNPSVEENSANSHSHAEKCLIPSLPYNSEQQSYNEAIEQGQSPDETEYKPLLNGKNSGNRPERRR